VNVSAWLDTLWIRSENVSHVSLGCTRILLVLKFANRVPHILPHNQLEVMPGQIVFVCRALRARMVVSVRPARRDSTRPPLGLQPAIIAPKVHFRLKAVQHQYLPARTALQGSIHQHQGQQLVKHVKRENIRHRLEATRPQIAHLATLAPTRIWLPLSALCVLLAVTRSAQRAHRRKIASVWQAIQKGTEVAWLVHLASSNRPWDRVNVRAARSEWIQSRQAMKALIAHVCPDLHWTVVCALPARLAHTRMILEIKRALCVQRTPNQTKGVYPCRIVCAFLDFPVRTEGLVRRAKLERIRSRLVHFVKVVLSMRSLRLEAMSAGTANAWLVSRGQMGAYAGLVQLESTRKKLAVHHASSAPPIPLPLESQGAILLTIAPVFKAILWKQDSVLLVLRESISHHRDQRNVQVAPSARLQASVLGLRTHVCAPSITLAP
jgi:hypothetical protein